METATDGLNTPAKGLSLDEAFAQLKASRNQAPEGEELENEDVDVDEEETEDIDEEEFDSEQDADEEEDSDTEDEDGEETDEEDGEEEDDVWEIEVEGETVEVTTDELHKGYLRHNDYTKKRQADAKRAKDLEAEYDTKLTQLNQALAQNVSQDHQQLKALQGQYAAAADDNAKRSIHYQMLQLQQNIGNRQAALNQANNLQKQTSAAKQEAYWGEQEEQLKVQFENWEDKKEELKGYLTSNGFEDLSMFAHASMATLVDKAKQFDELQTKRKSVASKKIKRKVGKVLKPGQGEKKLRVDKNRITNLEKQFAKTGSIKDAQALMRARRGQK